ncbi:Rab-GAP TBC domain-containing protein [Entamoeba marina]
MCDGVEAQKNVWLKFPRLFGFDDFHNLLIQNEDQIEDGYSSISIKWMELLNPSNDIFMAFLFHWTKFIYFTLKKSEDIVYYGEIPGLLQFTSLYITERLEKEKEHSTFLIKELDKRFILIGFPMNLNILIRRMLEKTNSYSIDSCNTALSKIGKWLTLVTEHKRFLNDSFDMEQIEMLLTCVFNTDHYQLIINALIMLFNTSKCFIGKCRIEMYENFLIERWFFKLFCHWNFYVRQAFQHFVLYRFLLIRRTHLNWAKFNKNELDLIKKHNKMGCNTEATDRAILAKTESKIASIKLLVDGDDNVELNNIKEYCIRAVKEYDKT